MKMLSEAEVIESHERNVARHLLAQGGQILVTHQRGVVIPRQKSGRRRLSLEKLAKNLQAFSPRDAGHKILRRRRQPILRQKLTVGTLSWMGVVARNSAAERDLPVTERIQVAHRLDDSPVVIQNDAVAIGCRWRVKKGHVGIPPPATTTLLRERGSMDREPEPLHSPGVRQLLKMHLFEANLMPGVRQQHLVSTL